LDGIERWNTKEPVTFRVEAFGCPSSQYEGEAVRNLMLKEGFQEAGRDYPDVFIINTCVVTEAAARKVRKSAQKAKKNCSRTLVVLIGCYPQVYPREVISRIPEAEIIMGTEGRSRLPAVLRKRLKKENSYTWNLVGSDLPQEPLEELVVDMNYRKIRPVVKIQEGCDRYCSYCIVSRARGRPRSLPLSKALEQMRKFLEKGYREVIITGTHLGLYGKDLEQGSLVEFLQCLEELDYCFRARLSYIEPGSVTSELLHFMGRSKKMSPYLYLPLQSASNRMLGAMGRGYTVEQLESIIHLARQSIAGVSIQADVIVGFPGETEKDHRHTIERFSRWELSGLHVFPYSPRPWTPAYIQDKERVSPEVIKRRSREMREVSGDLALAFHRKMEGSNLRVLVEKVEGGWARGFSDNNIWVKFPFGQKQERGGNLKGVGTKAPDRGDFVEVSPVKFYKWGIEGKISGQ